MAQSKKTWLTKIHEFMEAPSHGEPVALQVARDIRRALVERPLLAFSPQQV
jgi:hypothetical protein